MGEVIAKSLSEEKNASTEEKLIDCLTDANLFGIWENQNQRMVTILANDLE